MTETKTLTPGSKNTLNAHEQYELLVGEIGIKREDALYALKIWEILSIISGYRRRGIESWKRTRWQTFLILSALGSKLSTPEELLELPGDGDAERVEISEEEYDASMELIRSANAMNDK